MGEHFQCGIQLANLEERITKLRTENAVLRSKLEHQQAEVEKLENSNVAIGCENDVLKSQLDAARGEVERFVEERCRLVAELEKRMAVEASLDLVRQGRDAALSEVEKTEAHHSGCVFRLNERMEELCVDLARANERVKELEQGIENAAEALDDLGEDHELRELLTPAPREETGVRFSDQVGQDGMRMTFLDEPADETGEES